MRRGIVSIVVVAVVLSFSLVSSASTLLSDLALHKFATSNIIDWVVGDEASFDLDMGFLGKGSVFKKATKEEGNAIWIVTDAKTPMGAQKAEALVARDTGEILKLIVDGKEQKVEEPDLEIISKDAQEITVPAGTFKTVHLVVKDNKSGSDMEVWINPRDIPLGGQVKSIIKRGFLTVTMVLKSFSFADE